MANTDSKPSEPKAPRRPQTFGHIPGYPVGSRFQNRRELAIAGVHRVLRAGIHGNARLGTYSICLSGGYTDDEDHGDTIIYVGSGGRDPKTKKQVTPQTEQDYGNRSLLVSYTKQIPVRVVRGSQSESPFAPGWGYRYDGLYVVESFSRKLGKDGLLMFFFKLRKIREEGDRNRGDGNSSVVNPNADGIEDDTLIVASETISEDSNMQISDGEEENAARSAKDDVAALDNEDERARNNNNSSENCHGEEESNKTRGMERNMMKLE